MNKLVCSIIVWTCGFCRAQNLVPNGDFEFGPDNTSQGWCCRPDWSICSLSGGMAGPDLWTVVNAHPDRLIEGDIVCSWDNGTTPSGKAYIVFGNADQGKTKLTAPLEVNSVYKLSYLASSQTWQGNVIYPSYLKFGFNNGGNDIYSPNINDRQWRYYDTIFVANANSTELDITNMKCCEAAVNLDNILLEKLSATGINFISNISKGVVVYPNPVVTSVNISAPFNEPLEFLLYDVSSRNLAHLQFSNSISFNMEFLEKGAYFYKILYLKTTVSNGVILKE